MTVVIDIFDFKDSLFIAIFKAGISIIWSPMFMAVCFILYCLIIAERFPVMIRGTVSSISMLTGKAMAIMVPMMIARGTTWGFEPLVGAGLPIALSLPLIF